MEWTSAEIKRQREARSWTQQQLADAVGVSRRAVVSWEAGEANPQGRYAAQLERVFTAEDQSADPSDTLLLRDAGFVETLQHLFDLYQQAQWSGLSVDRHPLPPGYTGDHNVTVGPAEKLGLVTPTHPGPDESTTQSGQSQCATT